MRLIAFFSKVSNSTSISNIRLLSALTFHTSEQSQVLGQEAFENIVGKGENAGK